MCGYVYGYAGVCRVCRCMGVLVCVGCTGVFCGCAGVCMGVQVCIYMCVCDI